MARERAGEQVDDEPRSSKHRGHGRSDDEDEKAYYEDEKPSRRKKSHHKTEEESEDEDEDEAEERPRRNNKQLAVREKSKKSKSRGKEVARKKRQVTSSEDSSSESSEEEAPRKKSKSKKSKSRKAEMVMMEKYVVVSREDVDAVFVHMLVGELGHLPGKIAEWIEQDLLRYDVTNGEYNIDLMFEAGVLPRADRKKWESWVKKAKNSPERQRILHCSVHTGEASVMMGPSMRTMGPSMRTTVRTRAQSSFGMAPRDSYVYCGHCDDYHYPDEPCGYF
ncbi:MAG: hypothetical protein Q9168_000444 [Polycauliona sp. 1 TL-2023]